MGDGWLNKHWHQAIANTMLTEGQISIYISRLIRHWSGSDWRYQELGAAGVFF